MFELKLRSAPGFARCESQGRPNSPPPKSAQEQSTNSWDWWECHDRAIRNSKQLAADCLLESRGFMAR